MLCFMFGHSHSSYCIRENKNTQDILISWYCNSCGYKFYYDKDDDYNMKYINPKLMDSYPMVVGSQDLENHEVKDKISSIPYYLYAKFSYSI